MSGFLWAGSHESYGLVLQAQQKVTQAQQDMKADWLQEALDALPPLWEMRGTTAVVSINGPLVDGSAGLMRIFGVVGYDDIIEAAIEAASNPDTEALLYNIQTPGGDVNGIIDASNVLSKISALKPAAIYTGSQMASGGYWLASGIGGNITAGPTAVVGSIGVVMILTDMQGYLEQQGIKKTVVRSGQYKAELNPFETPTKEALDRLNSQMSDVHDLFRAQVAKGRPNLSSTQLAEVTQGQTFLGAKAKSAGLVDKVGNIDLALKLLDSQKSAGNTSSTSKGKTMKITDLTPEQVALIAAGGATAASLGVTDDVAATAATTATAAATQTAAATTATAAATAATAAAATAATAAAATAATTTTQAAPAPDVVAFYQSQLTTANAQLVTTQVELQQLKVSTQSMQTNFDGLMKIAREATGKLNVALGGSAAGSEGMDAATLIAEHTRVSATFAEKFKPGQQSAVQQVAAPAPKKADIDPAFYSAVKRAPSAA
jgi:signal peptide peptidase SppA